MLDRVRVLWCIHDELYVHDHSFLWVHMPVNGDVVLPPTM